MVYLVAGARYDRAETGLWDLSASKAPRIGSCWRFPAGHFLSPSVDPQRLNTLAFRTPTAFCVSCNRAVHERLADFFNRFFFVAAAAKKLTLIQFRRSTFSP